MINKLVWGVDLIEEQCLASVGIPSRPVLAKQPQVRAEVTVQPSLMAAMLQHAGWLMQEVLCKAQPAASIDS